MREAAQRARGELRMMVEAMGEGMARTMESGRGGANVSAWWTRALCVVLACGLMVACGDDSAGDANDPGTTTSGDPDAGSNNSGADVGTNNGTNSGTSDAGNNASDVPIPTFDPRAPGERAPLTTECDQADPLRCLLPWPSDAFVEADDASVTGLRVHVAQSAVVEGDSVETLNRADGFSRLSPVVTAYSGLIDPETVGDLREGALRVIVSEPGDALGDVVPMRYEVIQDPNAQGDESVVLAHPRVPYRAASEHVAVVLDTLRDASGQAPAQERSAAVALGLVEPESEDEARLVAYHAPSRAALEAAGIDFARVLRLWSFTTRSRQDPAKDLASAREQSLAALEAGQVGVAIDEVTLAPSDDIAMVVMGRLTELPLYLGETGGLTRDAEGAPVPVGTRDAVFRIVVPVGEGDYRIIMYGHGTGGNIDDSSFDGLMASNGAAKIGIQFDGWTDTRFTNTVADLIYGLSGSDRTAAGLVEALANGMTIQYALEGILGDALSAETIAGEANPAAGRRPDLSRATWAGGSLGGTMGMIYASAEPTVDAAVINVPGAGWSHFLRYSNLYFSVYYVLKNNYKREADVAQIIAMAQTNFDPADGGVWVDATDEAPIFLIQESIGDPVLPNIGNELVATSAGALHIGEVLSPIVDLDLGERAEGRTSITQYKVPQDVGPLNIHGFAGKNTPAGEAAQDQIFDFIGSYWDTGVPSVGVPEGCINNPVYPNSCDFSEAPDWP